jgi:cell division septal protein FtsQ
VGGEKRSLKATAATPAEGWSLGRPNVWTGMLFVAALCVGVQLAWRQFSPAIAQHQQYQIAAESIRITPLPPWIHTDIRAEVLRDAGLVGTLSVLDDSETLQQRVRDAFGFHPWVAVVRQITLALPASIHVELEYRRPIAAVQVATNQAAACSPIDVTGFRLPDAGFSDVERRYLPRIVGVGGQPLVGKPWTDQRVLEGARLAAALGDVWSQLRLVEIMPSAEARVRGDTRYHTFELTTSGGTRVRWGAAPGHEADAGESPFDLKRRRLVDYATQHGKLDSIEGPELVDVRSDLVVVPRTARRAPAEASQETETK